MQTLKLRYRKSLFEEWKSTALYEAWSRKYPGLFDENDVRIARSQHDRGYHFGEWFVAIHFAKEGYAVLMEKYQYKKHAEKWKRAQQVLGKDGFKFITQDKEINGNPPDLLIYDQDNLVYFFAEVKRSSDQLGSRQKAFFRQIEMKLGCQVLMVELSPI